MQKRAYMAVKYLLAVLYNAPVTISNYYQTLVSHDMAHGLV